MNEFDPTLSELVVLQRRFDIENFSGADTLDGKRTHVALHLGKLIGKYATVEEQADHGVVDETVLMAEIAPDLLVYAAQLTEYTGSNLSIQYARYTEHRGYRNVHQHDEVTLGELQGELDMGVYKHDAHRRNIYFDLHQPAAELASIERSRIMASGDIDTIRNKVAPQLVRSALEIANLMDMGLSEAYAKRLEYVAERNGNGRESAQRVLNAFG